MLRHIQTAWLYAYSSNGGAQADTFYTVFVAGPGPEATDSPSSPRPRFRT